MLSCWKRVAVNVCIVAVVPDAVMLLIVISRPPPPIPGCAKTLELARPISKKAETTNRFDSRLGLRRVMVITPDSEFVLCFGGLVISFYLDDFFGGLTTLINQRAASECTGEAAFTSILPRVPAVSLNSTSAMPLSLAATVILVTSFLYSLIGLTCLIPKTC